MKTAKLLVRPRKTTHSNEIKQNTIIDTSSAEEMTPVVPEDSVSSVSEQVHPVEEDMPVESTGKQPLMEDDPTSVSSLSVEVEQEDKPLDLSEVGVEITNDENLDSPVCYAENCGRSTDQY